MTQADSASAPQTMRWDRLLDDTRLGSEHRSRSSATVRSTETTRSEFQKDQDRLIFSEPFRKLGRKTQVHPLPQNDRVHNRLTHSLEVSCVGRSLGELAGKRLHAEGHLPVGVVAADVAAIVQAACLAHDIGNPPFGHAGEFAIRDWYVKQDPAFFAGMDIPCIEDLRTFEGNAQGFRLLTSLVDTAGLRLTYATLGSFIKYPWSATQAPRYRPGKFSYFDSEREVFATIARSMGLLEVEPGVYCRHPLAYFVEAADDICYAIIDIEDGIEMGILHTFEVEELLLSVLQPALRDQFTQFRDGRSDRQRVRWLRGKAVDLLIEGCAASFFDNADAILSGRFPSTLVEVGNPDIARGVAAAKTLARERIFTHTRKMEIEIGAYAAVDTLLDACSDAARELLAAGSGHTLSYRASRILGLMGESAPTEKTGLEDSYRLINDFLSSLTDNRATELAQVIRGRG
ncbi:deoxyguanosinetriphosphate triphosphohydrolase [Lichenicola cladoniae]|uniref:Deoxyguanosinetriphosphate triphosphohydrolase n=1 Tax=Lichenicola cladoniae TaxID=1484109 RepID=A0A6M8HQE1_9PROT|nr:deoxyguanosinetriphosphate triphosphohydrolase [Lichenicola cladoniae]NPD67884.1 deoxyguanosinetriphosphate triphosphohydrolase [Acetobacteraceae bacterium]QKE90485.1 deoxyguanosinetriphosphate triphosphohydrolase [Lichenicola cladoniae]